ncbi:TPA: thymidylate synthase [Klebsiella pneumoniae]|uniref:thymidylate synthase n=1 Tax=Klebsiella sp. K4-74 TaxID=2920180 RepID=UPI002370E83E|nr:thymidylate synthase [Klebsiella sp. K4-74]HBR4177533.1 thymidylate synthase [Klebsiella pneumoniae]MDK1919770.1 thymidylate synthase [Klebsiella sp. K4-74]HBR4230823.1 thymidylate synthase [Klebsiella pneumoniae]HBR4986864.1 thymidylate synthase [Klebsiella pneumoniae]HBS6304400.1 thymidylate synthase [Klebsiella pneumoniae]
MDFAQLNDAAYIGVINSVLSRGIDSQNRTGVETTGTCFILSDYALEAGNVPLISTKAVNLKPLLVELEWYLRGEGNISFLKEHGVKIWDAWADANGDLGPVYGRQWRKWEDTRIVSAADYAANKEKYDERGYHVEGELENRVVISREIDQLQRIVNSLRDNPTDRRMLMSAWNVGQLEDMALQPCHFVFYVWSRELEFEDRLRMANDIAAEHVFRGISSKYVQMLDAVAKTGEINEETLNELEIPTRMLCSSVIQRSVDVFVGMPFNIAGYGILTHFLAHITNHMPSMMSHYGCDVHIYADHAEGLKEFGQREIPVDSKPIVLFPDTWRELNDFRWEDVVIDGYKPLPWIKVPVAV